MICIQIWRFYKRKNKEIFLTEITWREWLQILDEFWNELYTPYSGDFDFWTQWLFQYYYELPLGGAIEMLYLTWKSEKQRLTPTYDILSSFFPLVIYGPDHPINNSLFLAPCMTWYVSTVIFWEKEKIYHFLNHATSGGNTHNLITLKLETLNTMKFRLLCRILCSYKYL